MHNDKLGVFARFSRRQTQEEKELALAGEKIKQEADAVRSMMKTKGWKLTDEFFTSKKKVIRHKMETCHKDELPRLQDELRMIDDLYRFFNSKLLRDPDL